MINFKNIHTKKFATSSFIQGAKSRRCRAFGYVGDERAMKDRVVFKSETKGGVSSGIGAFEPTSKDWDKRDNIKGKI